MYNVFNGKIPRNMDTSEFLKSEDAKVLKLRHTILYSARLAFHICIDKFIMAEFDLPSHDELTVSV